MNEKSIFFHDNNYYITIIAEEILACSYEKRQIISGQFLYEFFYTHWNSSRSKNKTSKEHCIINTLNEYFIRHFLQTNFHYLKCSRCAKRFDLPFILLQLGCKKGCKMFCNCILQRCMTCSLDNAIFSYNQTELEFLRELVEGIIRPHSVVNQKSFPHLFYQFEQFTLNTIIEEVLKLLNGRLQGTVR